MLEAICFGPVLKFLNKIFGEQIDLGGVLGGHLQHLDKHTECLKPSNNWEVD